MCYLPFLREWQVFTFIIMANQIKQEIILQDGKFYKRSIIETFLLQQEDALRKIDQSSVFYVSPFQPKKDVYSAAFIGSGSNQSSQFFIKEIEGFHFRGATLKKLSNDSVLEGHDDQYCMNVTDPFILPNSSDQYIQTRTFNDNQGLIWKPSVMGFRMFIIFEYELIKTIANSTELARSRCKPSVFVYHVGNKKSYIPNLANVYDRGSICTGDDFETTSDTWSKLMDTNLTQLKQSYCNNDLRMSTPSEARFLAFDKDGNTLPKYDAIPKSNEDGNAYYLQSTLEPIVEFTKWLSKT